MTKIFYTFNKKAIHRILFISGEVEKKGDGFIAVNRDTRKLKARSHGWAILGNKGDCALTNLIN